MEELVQILTNENCQVELYLNQIITLNDEEIVALFENENISVKVKNNVLMYASERISHLSTHNFIIVSRWAENIENYIKNYFPKIEKMPYPEFVDLIYNGIYEPEILIEIMKTDVYSRYLQQEREEPKTYDIQCFDIQGKLDSFDSMEELDSIGLETLNIIKENKKTENMELMEYVYLNTLIENIDLLPLDSKSIKIGLNLMTIQMKRHQILTMKMIEFYLYYRIKELNLKSVCKNVIVTLGSSNHFGHYTLEGEILGGGVLRIYYEYLINLFQKYNQSFCYEGINDVININFLEFISHELKHALQMFQFKRITEKLDNTQYFETIYTNKEINYFLRNGTLLYKVGEEKYHKYHDTFIKEVQANLFSFFDTNNQILTNFKDCYPQYMLENNVMTFARRIVEFYTNEDGTMLSPMEKFDTFYLENIGEKKEPIVTAENPDIISSLMMGDKIPLDVYEFIKKIANKEIKTTNLLETLMVYLQNNPELSTPALTNEVEKQTPTL